MNSGLTTIEEVRSEYNTFCEESFDHVLMQVQMKCWLNHSESRHRNGNKPFTFNNYVDHMNIGLYLEQIRLNMIDCDDIGGKEKVITFLESRL